MDGLTKNKNSVVIDSPSCCSMIYGCDVWHFFSPAYHVQGSIGSHCLPLYGQKYHGKEVKSQRGLKPFVYLDSSKYLLSYSTEERKFCHDIRQICVIIKCYSRENRFCQ